MTIVIALLVVLIILVIANTVIGTLQANSINWSIDIMRQEISDTLASVQEQTTVIEGVVTFIKAHTQAVDEALDAGDLDALRQANETLKSNTARLAQAIAVNTDASDEVHEDDGGSGDDNSAVDVSNADTGTGSSDTGGAVSGGETTTGTGDGGDLGAGTGSGTVEGSENDDAGQGSGLASDDGTGDQQG